MGYDKFILSLIRNKSIGIYKKEKYLFVLVIKENMFMKLVYLGRFNNIIRKNIFCIIFIVSC